MIPCTVRVQLHLKLNLRMKLSDVEFQGDGKKATFYYTADERVDFRELIKKLADEFKIRIEMRQIGMRQEASRLGGIGSCGRELCCSTWLTDFKIVSTSAARYQNLSLNPLKLAGQCGKLKCCLNYELDSYLDAISDIPDANTKLETQKGYALHRKTDIFKRMMWFTYVEDTTHAAINSDSWIALSVDRVKEIVQMNKQSEKPVDLNDYVETLIKEKPMDYADVVGQDSLTRMMDKKKKKKKKPNSKPGSPQGTTQGEPRQRERTFNASEKPSPQSPAKPRQPERPTQDRPNPRPPRQQTGNQPSAPQQPGNQQSSNQHSGNQSQNRPQRTPIKPSAPTDQKPVQQNSPAPQQQKPVQQAVPVPQQPKPSSPPDSGSPNSGNSGTSSSGRVRVTPPRTNPPQE